MVGKSEWPTWRTQIASYLSSNPRATAAEIAGALGASKKQVNAQLYRHDEFQSDGAERPRWTVVSSVPTAVLFKKVVETEVARTSGWPKRPKFMERNERIVRRYLDGATVKELVKEFYLGAQQVRQILRSDARTRDLKVAKRPMSVREEQMVAMRVAGLTLQDIGDHFELSRERVRQILKKYDDVVRDTSQSQQQDMLKPIFAAVSEGKSIAEISELLGVPIGRVESLLEFQTGDDENEIGELRSATAEIAVGSVKAFLLKNPGLTLKEVAELTGCSTSFIRRSLPSLVRRLTVTEDLDSRAASAKVWSDEQILEAIRHAATYEFPITVKHFDYLRSIGEVLAPSAPLVYMRFGSWRAACEAAGVESGEPARHNYESKWTDEDLLRFAGQFLAAESSDGTFGGFTKWLEQEVDRPSGATIRNRLGGWLEVKRAALTADWFKDLLGEER